MSDEIVALYGVSLCLLISVFLPREAQRAVWYRIAMISCLSVRL